MQVENLMWAERGSNRLPQAARPSGAALMVAPYGLLLICASQIGRQVQDRILHDLKLKVRPSQSPVQSPFSTQGVCMCTAFARTYIASCPLSTASRCCLSCTALKLRVQGSRIGRLRRPEDAGT